MFYRILILLVGGLFGRVSASRECNPTYEFPCNDGECVHKLQWCDSVPDCLDKSDEKYCNEANCPEFFFRCSDGKCLPLSVVCDNFNDCYDSSDEAHCFTVHVANTSVAENSFEGDATHNRAIAKAVEYLMSQRDADYGWKTFTPRAVVALSFANRVLPVAEERSFDLVKKQLNVQLLLDLMQSRNSMTLSSLALYINALYATCQDPRNFQGIDLVAQLRSDTDAAMAKNSSIPIAFFTLCIAGEMRESDTYRLADLYKKDQFARTSSRALIMMAMMCYQRLKNGNLFHNYRESFLDSSKHDVDVYSEALLMQARIATGHPVVTEELKSKQLPDGSFGDMLATYYAIPILMNASLLELKCNNTINTGMENAMPKSKGEHHVVYSLWISIGNDVNSHSLTLTSDGRKTFFEIMLMAAARDPLYRFLYDETSSGKKVYSIAGIPNDAESGKSWMLYSGQVRKVVVNSVQNLVEETLGVDKLFPENNDHLVFWFKRDPQL